MFAMMEKNWQESENEKAKTRKVVDYKSICNKRIIITRNI
jgi:hypothetical protein